MARRWKVLLVTSVAVFMALLDVTVVNVAFPDIRRAFPADSLSDLSWIMNAYNVVFAATLVPAGRLADRFGRRRFFLAGMALFLAASVACAMAPSLAVLVVARIAQSVGAAVLLPTSLSLILPEFPAQKRALATALWTATGAVAAAAGPSFGGLLVEWQGWRWVFLVNLLIGLPALVPAVRLLREAREERPVGWPDLPGAGLLAVGVAAVALALVEGNDWGWGSVGVLGTFAAGIVLLVLFVARSARHATPVVELSLFRGRSFAVANVSLFVFCVGFYAQLLNVVLFLTDQWEYSALAAGLLLTPGPIAATVCAPIAGRLADRVGQRALAVPGAVVFSAGALFLALATTSEPDYVGAFLPGIVLAGVGAGFALPSFSSAAVADLPPARFATGVAVSTSFRQLGAVIGIAVLIGLVGQTAPDQITKYQQVWILIATSGFLAAFLSAALRHPLPRGGVERKVVHT